MRDELRLLRYLACGLRSEPWSKRQRVVVAVELEDEVVPLSCLTIYNEWQLSPSYMPLSGVYESRISCYRLPPLLPDRS